MDILFYIVSSIAGFLLLYYGAELLVRNASKLALLLGVSSLTVGLTVVAFGTSLPELAVSMMSRVQGKDDILIGNIIGSNIANLALILALSAIIAPLVINKRTIRFEMPFAFGTSLLLFFMGLSGGISRLEAAFLLLLFVSFIGYASLTRKPTELLEAQQIEERKPKSRKGLMIVAILVSLVLLPIGGKLLIYGAIGLAEKMGVSERVISITLIAGGTSFPELAVCLVAAIRRKHGIAVGNVVGSNIFNVLLVGGLAGMVRPASFQKDFLAFDMPFLLFISILFMPFFASGRKLSRIEGAIALTLYCVYLVAVCAGWLQSAG